MLLKRNFILNMVSERVSTTEKKNEVSTITIVYRISKYVQFSKFETF